MFEVLSRLVWQMLTDLKCAFKTACCQASDPCTVDHRSFTSLNTNTRLYVLSINTKCYDVNVVNKVGDIKDLIGIVNAGFIPNK